MTRYLTRRLLAMVVAVWGVSTLVFLLIRMSGDPATLLAGPDATADDIARLRVELGLSDPLPVQYARFLSELARGDLGISMRYKQPALAIVASRVPATLQLTVTALALSAVVGITAGVVAAVRRGTLVDNAVILLSLVGQCMPAFWLGIILIWIFAVEWRVLPASGTGTIQHLILPSLTLAAYMIARTSRLTRSSILDVLRQDYVRTARAKGLHERVVMVAHALRNAALPVITILGLSLVALLGGAIVTETIFAWPGVGRLLVQAVQSRDYPLVQACVLVVAVLVVATNLVIDLLYAILDPRIRFG